MGSSGASGSGEFTVHSLPTIGSQPRRVEVSDSFAQIVSERMQTVTLRPVQTMVQDS